MSKRVWCVAFLYLVVGCNSFKTIKGVFADNPYDKYVSSLQKAGLDNTSLGKEWLQAGKRVFDDSIYVQLPFIESGYFQATEPEARSFQFEVREGQVLTIQTVARAKGNSKMFTDLFVWKNNKWQSLAFADSNNVLNHEFDENARCLLRIQPELLVNAFFTLSISRTPVLINPVKGAGNLSIGSMYGVPREGGSRTHEGVDIFASKGTPVVAPTSGIIAKTGTTARGGKVIWMYDTKRGHSYYFAHLDKQLVVTGRKVKQGDTLGLVGNTGNAAATPPHLHFGIYQHGSKDPIDYIRSLDRIVTISEGDTSFEPQEYKVKSMQAMLRSGPSEKYNAKKNLPEKSYLRIVGQSQEWYHVVLPDKKQGFVAKNLVGPIEIKGSVMELMDESVLLSEPHYEAAPIAYIKRFTKVFLLAKFEQFAYIRTKKGIEGWVAI